MANLKVTAEESVDVVRRAIKTFVQAFLAQVIVTNIATLNVATAKQIGLAGIAAGLSAVSNLAYNRTK